MTASIDIDAIVHGQRPSYGGVTFLSRPAALRQLIILREIVERIPGEGIGLDVGSKYADLTRLLDGYGIRCVRLDVQTREDQRDLLLGDGQQLPFADASFDFVVLSHVLAHVDDVETFMAEISRIVKPDGRLILVQSNRYGWWKFWGYYIRRNDRVVHHRTFDAWGLEKLLASNSFSIERIFAPYHFYLHAKDWNFMYWLDRRLEGRVPKAFSTQWLVVGKRQLGDVASPGLLSRWPLPFVWVLAPLHAVALKMVELAIRFAVRMTGRVATGGGEN
jgi:SAM-dependent methyltransferase